MYDPNADSLASAQADMSSLIEQGNAATDDLVDELAITGDYSDAGLGRLIAGLNAILPCFGVTEKLDKGLKLDEDGRIPMEVNRYVLASADAINDAVELEILDPEMAVDLDGITDDTALTQLSGLLRTASVDKAFKKFLKEPADEIEEPEADEQPEPETEPEQDEDELFASRL